MSEVSQVRHDRDGRAGWRPSSAVRTAPNAITAVRLALVPACGWLLYGGHWVAGSGLTALVGATDWVDGWLARRTGQVSRLGQLMDPFADRLLILAVAVALLARGVLPWPAAGLLVARDVALLVGFLVLRRLGVRPPEVVPVGKAATFVLLWALPVLVLGEANLPVSPFLRLLGYVILWCGIALYYLAGVVYARLAMAALSRG